MSRTVLYLAPAPPVRSGIVEYADRFASAVQEFSSWRFERALNAIPLTGNSLHDFWAARDRVESWKRAGVLDRASLVHAEIGVKEHALFHEICWLTRFAPDLPYCITVHDPPLVVAPVLYPLCFGLGSALIRRSLRILDGPAAALVRPVLSAAAALFALSDSGAAAVRQLVPGHPRVRSLPHVNFYRTPPDISARRNRADVRILYFGFWSAAKGLDVLIDAMESLYEAVGGAATLVLSGGPDTTALGKAYAARLIRRIERSPARSAIDVAGFLPEQDVDAAFAAADMLILPYTERVGQSTSGVLTRAMAAGLPVVASAVGTVPERIRDGVTGILTPPGDSEALFRAMLSLVQDRDARGRMGSAAQEAAFATHGRSRVATLVTAEYDAAARSGPTT